METEADFGENHFGGEVSLRRRTNSTCTDDYNVQRTNDDATQCKYVAVQMHYFEDPFIHRFFFNTPDTPLRRDPEISIGYWARISAINKYVDDFLLAHPDGQILNLGCGFDTLFWRLKALGKVFSKVIEVDFSSVTARKIRQILKPGKPNLVELFSQPPQEVQHCDLHCGDYELVGADIRQWNELKEKLDCAKVDFTLPTMVITECVLVYMSEDQSASLLANLRNFFGKIVLINYEQLNTNDTFGKVMQENLAQRGLNLSGLAPCESGEKQKARFEAAGFPHVQVLDMSTIYKTQLDQTERKRIEAIEHLDEMELLYQLLQHYGIVIGSTEPLTSN
ncbi:unnamed protein product, partial [Mesorhabditis belari]|uniref:Leucine carboxyl methyltransferase 1 n=1 Tax=Mesorhabditis belari TaxID=2138241 RepID=A0AAF3FIF8_9BILA